MNVFIVYDRSRHACDGWGYWRVATYRTAEAAATRVAEGPSTLFVSCQRATVRDLAFVGGAL